MINKLLLLTILMCSPISYSYSETQDKESLDSSLAPTGEDDVSSVFIEMGVIQKKKMKKSNRFLLSSYISLDFSDDPYTNYSFHLNPGYAINDYFEVYLNFVPYYYVSKRSIVDLVEQITTIDNKQATITAAKPKLQYGVEVLWSPLYGKDSMGVSRVIRSDTFVKLGVSQIKYETTSGLAFKLGVGKSFFLSKHTSFRFCIDYGHIQSVINSEKNFNGQLLLESGILYYF